MSPRRSGGLAGPAVDLAADDRLADGLDADAFRAAFRNHAAGVAVITADAGDGPVALTATSVFSVSATPPLLVFSISALSSAAPTIARAGSVVVHLLDADQVELGRLCATSGVDRFADRDRWERLPSGEPVFRDAATRIRGTVVNRLEAGTSTLVVVHATHATSTAGAHAGPLVYHNRTWHALGEGSRI